MGVSKESLGKFFNGKSISCKITHPQSFGVWNLDNNSNLRMWPFLNAVQTDYARIPCSHTGGPGSIPGLGTISNDEIHSLGTICK